MSLEEREERGLGAGGIIASLDPRYDIKHNIVAVRCRACADVVSHESLLAAYGAAGEPERAEASFSFLLAPCFAASPLPAAFFKAHIVPSHAPPRHQAAFARMLEAGLPPRDYSFLALISAHSGGGIGGLGGAQGGSVADAGDSAPRKLGAGWTRALAVRRRMRQLGCEETVHTANAALEVLVRARQWAAALDLYHSAFTRAAASDVGGSATAAGSGSRSNGRVLPNAATAALMKEVARGGSASIEAQQAVAATVSAAVAAAAVAAGLW